MDVNMFGVFLAFIFFTRIKGSDKWCIECLQIIDAINVQPEMKK